MKVGLSVAPSAPVLWPYRWLDLDAVVVGLVRENGWLPSDVERQELRHLTPLVAMPSLEVKRS